MNSRIIFWISYNASSFGRASKNTPKQFAKLVHFKGYISPREDKRGLPDPVSMDLTMVKEPILETWQQIAPDIEAVAQVKLNNKICIECCLDQDNLITFARHGRRAETVIVKAIDEFGYEQVLQYLSREIKLR